MPRPDETPSTADQAEARPSKTRRKADMAALQDLGEALVQIDPSRLRELGLPDQLAQAISETRRITQRGARRRQLQFIGRLMREVEAEPIRARLAQWSDAPNREKARLHAIERWRQRLLDEDTALAEFCVRFPVADRPALAELVEHAQRERARGASPRAYRDLFRALGALVASSE
jgi:ribosome-associated protein